MDSDQEIRALRDALQAEIAKRENLQHGVERAGEILESMRTALTAVGERQSEVLHFGFLVPFITAAIDHLT